MCQEMHVVHLPSFLWSAVLGESIKFQHGSYKVSQKFYMTLYTHREQRIGHNSDATIIPYSRDLIPPGSRVVVSDMEKI